MDGGVEIAVEQAALVTYCCSSLPEYEVEVGEGEHEDADKSGGGAAEDGSEHVPQGHDHSAVLVAYAGQEALQTMKGKFGYRPFAESPQIQSLPCKRAA